MDFAELAAHGAHEAAGSAADFESAAGGGRCVGGEAAEFAFEIADEVGRGGEEFGVVLIAAAEGDVVIGVFARAIVPIGAHALAYVFHVVSLALYKCRHARPNRGEAPAASGSGTQPQNVQFTSKLNSFGLV